MESIVNPVYIGDMEQGTQKEAMHMGIKKHRIKKEDRIYVAGTHEPVVSRELFDRVQQLVEERKKQYLRQKRNMKALKERIVNLTISCSAATVAEG